MPQDTRDKVVNALIELAEQNPEKSYFTFSEIAKHPPDNYDSVFAPV